MEGVGGKRKGMNSNYLHSVINNYLDHSQITLLENPKPAFLILI